MLALCYRGDGDELTFFTVAFWPVCSNPFSISPFKISTSEPSISLVGSCFGRFPYCVWPSEETKRMSRSKAIVSEITLAWILCFYCRVRTRLYHTNVLITIYLLLQHV
jgi:hypothetical protein